MASSGKSLSYSRASAEDDEDDHSDGTRSRSGDNRDDLRNAARRMQPDPKVREQYLNAADRERQHFDDSLRQQRDLNKSAAGSASAGATPTPHYPTSRSPSTSHRGVLPESFRIDTPPSQAGRLRATPSASPRPASPASPFVMIQEERLLSGVPPKPTTRVRSSSADLMKRVESAAGDLSDSQRAQMMRILAGDNYTVMTNEERNKAEKHYQDATSVAQGLQHRCDDLASLNRDMAGANTEKTRRMEGLHWANADLAAQVSDMRSEVRTARSDELQAIKQVQLAQESEIATRGILKTSEHELLAAQQAGRDLQASLASMSNEEEVMSAKLAHSETNLRLVESSLQQSNDHGAAAGRAPDGD